MKGYYGLNWVCLANFGIAIALEFGVSAPSPMPYSPSPPPGSFGIYVNPALIPQLSCYVVMCVAFMFIPYKLNKELGFGMGWSRSGPIIVSVLMGFNALCYGLVGITIVQQIAMAEMQKYGVRPGFFRSKREEIMAILAQRRAQESQLAATPTAPPMG
jgi:hypothetical protein